VSAQGFDVAVIGGGLHGLSAALHLARAGRRTVVLERSWVGRHASGATAAGVRTLGRDLAEVPISLEADRMANFDPKGFDSEKAVVLEERRLRTNDTWRRGRGG